MRLPVRHERRDDDGRVFGDRPQDGGIYGRHPRRRPLPQRFRPRGRAVASGRRKRGVDGAGHPQRHRREKRQRQPVHDYPQPLPQNGPRALLRGQPQKAPRPLPVRRRNGEPAQRHPPSVRGVVVFRAQGGRPRRRRQQGKAQLRAHRPVARRQQDPRARERHVRQGVRYDEGARHGR